MNTKKITQGAVVAALYVVLTYIVGAFDLASNAIQVRISEALCILPIFTPAAVLGLTVGCLISNLLLGGILPDVVFGTLATLIGALGTRALRNRPVLALIPPILANTVIVPIVLIFGYHVEQAAPIVFLGVFVGEVISVGILGYLLYLAFKSHKNIFE